MKRDVGHPAVPMEAEPVLQRVLGACRGAEPGPLLLVTAGVHGNEPAGVRALRRVLAVLTEPREGSRGRMRGTVLGLAGNLAALKQGARYLDVDLNRMFQDEPPAGSMAEPRERRERRDLLAEIEPRVEAQAKAGEKVFLLDLHSTSGGGPPFAILEDNPRSRELALALGLPAILDLHKQVSGTLLEWFDRRRIPALVVEGGQSEAPETVDHLESAVWIALARCGMLERALRAGVEEHRARLAAAARGLPRFVRIFLRWHVEEAERFAMEPGFRSFQRIAEGALLARSRRAGDEREREIRAPADAILLMPRYQAQGADGFFLGRDA